MSRIDIATTEADFIEFRFADEETAQRAERYFPSDFVRTSPGVIEYRVNSILSETRKDLERAGFQWDEAESSLTEEIMWPEWPEDEDTFTP